MLAIIKKELKSYLLSPIGYIFIGLFLLIFSVFFMVTIFTSRVINFEYLFYNGATILTFVTPILTMRMFAEERKNGTEQLLLTSPRGITSIVLGKFLAAGIIILITEALTFMYFIILDYFGNPSLLVALSTLFGFFLLSLAYISFGMFASSITENQIIAGVLTVGFLVISLFASSISPILSDLTLIEYYLQFAQGVISLENTISLLLFTFVFISLTMIVMQRRKLVK